MFDRLRKYLRIREVLALDPVFLHIIAVKSPYELEFQKKAGHDHDHLLMEVVPDILREGIE